MIICARENALLTLRKPVRLQQSNRIRNKFIPLALQIKIEMIHKMTIF